MIGLLFIVMVLEFVLCRLLSMWMMVDLFDLDSFMMMKILLWLMVKLVLMIVVVLIFVIVV